MLRRTVGEASPNRVVVRLDMDYSCAAQRLVVQIGFELREASDIERTADTGEGRHHRESIPGIELLDQFGILQSVIDGAVSQLQACKVVDRPVEDLQLRGLHVHATAGSPHIRVTPGPTEFSCTPRPAVAWTCSPRSCRSSTGRSTTLQAWSWLTAPSMTDWTMPDSPSRSMPGTHI